MPDCPNIIRSEVTGALRCPKEAGVLPPEWETWEDYCDACRANQERWLELEGQLGPNVEQPRMEVHA